MKFDTTTSKITSIFRYFEAKYGELFKDSVIASAILDRLLHHSIIYNITGNSYRIKDKIEPTEQNEDKK